MLSTILTMYITLMPAVLAGVFNMIWCTLPVASGLKKPIDKGKSLADGKRVFGANKTWKGFVGMILFGMLFSVIWGLLCRQINYLQTHNFFYRQYTNTVLYNLATGFFVGFAYVLFELPNSFLKRRLGIKPGRMAKESYAPIFVFIDQADSLFGVVLVVALFYPMSIGFYFFYVFLGAITHILINIMLYFAKLRKNPF